MTSPVRPEGPEPRDMPTGSPSPDKTGQATGGKPARRQRLPERARTVAAIAVTLAAVLLVRAFVAQNFEIPSDSMTNTLWVGDQVVVDKVLWHASGLHRGDIVVFDGSGNFDPAGTHKDYIKRIIGLPGDIVTCCDAAGQIAINGITQHESYVNSPDGVPFGPFRVPPGQLFLLGDHRSDSYDSRYRGFVPRSAVIGVAHAVIWPLNHLTGL